MDEHPLVRADPPDGYVVSPSSLAFPSWHILGSGHACHGLKWELPAWCQTPALSCYQQSCSTKDAGDTMTTAQNSSELLPTAILVSFKLSVFLKLSVWTSASQRRLDRQWLLLLLCPYWIRILLKYPKFLGVLKVSLFFKNNQGFLLATLPIMVLNSLLFPTACGTQLFPLSLNSRLGLQLHHRFTGLEAWRTRLGN